MKNVLITGGCGFIGSHLAHHLYHNTEVEKIIIIDPANPFRLYDLDLLDKIDVIFYQAKVEDIDIKDIVEEWDIDTVFHYAATVGVVKTIEEPVKVSLDMAITVDLLTTLKKCHSVKRFVFSSSSEVYGVVADNVTEKSALNVHTLYASVKIGIEYFILDYLKGSDITPLILRFFNTAGPLQDEAFIVPAFVTAAMNGEPMRIFGTGSNARCYTHVRDNVRATTKLIEKNATGVFNLGCSDNANIQNVRGMADLVAAVVGIDAKIEKVPELYDVDTVYRQPNNDKLMSVIAPFEFVSVVKIVTDIVDYKYKHGVKEPTNK